MCIADYSLYDPDSSGPGDGRDLEQIVDELIQRPSEETQWYLQRKEQKRRAFAALVTAAAQTEPGIPIECPRCGHLLYVPAPEPSAAD